MLEHALPQTRMPHKSANRVVSVKARLFRQDFIQAVNRDAPPRHLVAIRCFRQKWVTAEYFANLP